MAVFQPYPAARYHYSGNDAVVHNAEEDEALGGGWAERPHDWQPYKEARRLGPQHDPIKWVNQWSLEGLGESDRKQIKARLLEIHSSFWETPDKPADIQSMVLAFTQIAQVLYEAELLTEQHLTQEIPELVWDSAIAAGWWRLASESPSRMFREKLGHYWVFRDDTRNWDMLFGAAVAEWRARLLGREPRTDAMPPKQRNRKISPAAPRAQQWEDIHIQFLSEERIEISIHDWRETRNYGEMGCQDRRSGKPNQSWALLLLLAQHEGFVPLNRKSQRWVGVEKQIERTRNRLKEYFGLTDDPLPLEKGRGYRLCCEISLAPSFHA